MPVLVVSHELFASHEPGPGHPERPERLLAVERALGHEPLRERIVRRTVDTTALAGVDVHDPGVLERLHQLDRVGGGSIDPDTASSPGSLSAALIAAGTGVDAIRALEADPSLTAAFCAVRPPGHHATRSRSMGFCLLNNVAVCASWLRRRGERVAIVDYDAHHGNGTQDIFYDAAEVLYVSIHQSPLYPGTGMIDEIGTGAGTGTTINLPVPPGTEGQAYRLVLDEVVLPRVASFAPDWLLLSVGFDAHRADPLTDLGLSAGDYGILTELLRTSVPAGRTVAFLEGGYDLRAIESSTIATVSALAGPALETERATAGTGVETVRRMLAALP